MLKLGPFEMGIIYVSANLGWIMQLTTKIGSGMFTACLRPLVSGLHWGFFLEPGSGHE